MWWLVVAYSVWAGTYLALGIANAVQEEKLRRMMGGLGR